MKTTTIRFGFVAALALAGGACKHHNDPNEFDFSVPEDLFGVDQSRALPPADDLLNFEAAICASKTELAQQVGVDLLFLLDNSYSMDYNLKWISVSNALEQFLDDPTLTGVGVGLQYFPLRQACNVSDYGTFNVPVTPLTPAGISALDASINMRQMSGNTPTLPAIEGTLQYALQNQQLDTSRKTIVVLATDGIPDGTCSPPDDQGPPNDIASVVNVVHSYATGSPPIPTYVIGVGDNLNALDAIAAAGGGTPKAFHIDTSANTEAQFADDLNTIRQQSLVCQFSAPLAEPGQTLDYSKVNIDFVQVTGNTSSTVNYVYVGSESDCSKAPYNGWYYDNAQNPTEIILCSDTCNLVRNATNGQINIVVGCAQIVT